MLQGCASHRVKGLHSVVLSNTSAVNRKKRRGKTWAKEKKISLTHCLGWYIPGVHRQPGNIEIIVDTIQSHYPNWIFKSNFLTDMVLSDVLFHEVGHHIHITQAPEHKCKEDVADKWQSKLSRKYFWKNYWYIIVFFLPLRGFIKWVGKRINSKQTR